MAWWSGYLNPLQGFFWTFSNQTLHSGIDLPDQCGTPMTAALPGKVIQSSQEPWGGQISIESVFGGVPIVYTYLHGSSQTVKAGDTVQAGQLVGYSGQPPPGAGYGSGCHVHFEVNTGTLAPYTQYNVWSSTQANHPINPVPLLAYVATQSPAQLNTELSTNVTSQSGTSTGTGFDWGSFLQGIGTDINKLLPIPIGGTPSTDPLSGIQQVIANLSVWFGNPIRLLKLTVGVILLSISFLALILPEAAPIAAGAAAVAAGQPEAALPIANAVRSVTKRNKNAPPAPQQSPGQALPGAIGAVGQARQTDRIRAQRNAPQTRPIARQYGTPLPPPRVAPVTAPLAPRGRLGRPPNPPMPAVTRPLPPLPPRVAPVTVPLPPVQRGRRTGLSNTYFGGARTVMTRTPISDQEVDYTRKLIQRGQRSSEARTNKETNKQRINEAKARAETARKRSGQFKEMRRTLDT